MTLTDWRPWTLKASSTRYRNRVSTTWYASPAGFARCPLPVALVSFVAADRQWFKANVGFPHCETDLDRSVCKHVLAEPDLLVIPDLSEDHRTARNPLVTGDPGIRFYAGAPLRTSEGQVFGSLCVIDTVPRPAGLTAEQADDLRALARNVESLLAMRRAVEHRDVILDIQSVELRQARRLDVLAKAAEALLGADDPMAVLDRIQALARPSLRRLAAKSVEEPEDEDFVRK